MIGFQQYKVSQTKSIQLINVDDRGSRVFVTFSARYSDGTKKVLTAQVKYLDNYFQIHGGPSNIKKAEALGVVYLGILKTDGRVLFVLKLYDGGTQLVQVKENSWEFRKLLELCDA